MVELKRKLWSHQKRAFDLATEHGVHALLHEPGTGKTFTSIEIMREWFARNGRVLKTLILCPPIVVENWKREIKAFSKVGHHVIPLVGTGIKRCQTVRKHLQENKIFVTNYESLNMKSLLDLLLDWQPELIIYDELHKLKNPSAVKTKAAMKLSALSRYRLGLTGTAILNSPMDLFSQFLVLDNGETFGNKFYTFRAKYFYDKNAGMRGMQKYFPNWQILPGALEEIEKRMARISSVAKKEDCLDLPPLVRKTVYVELSKEQRRLYEEMKRDFVTYMGDKACTADLAIVKALRLQQIVSGFIPMADAG